MDRYVLCVPQVKKKNMAAVADTGVRTVCAGFLLRMYRWVSEVALFLEREV